LFKKKDLQLQLLLLSVLMMGLVAACGREREAPTAAQYDARVPIEWFKLYLLLFRDTRGMTPPITSRIAGYAGVTLYEAVVPGMPTHQSLAGQLNGLTQVPQPVPGEEYHWPTVANNALGSITRLLFPRAEKGHREAIDSLEARFNQEFKAQLDSDVFTRSVNFGGAVALAIYQWSLTDGGATLANFPTDYTPPVGPGLWEMTPRKLDRGMPQAPLPAMQPYWGNVRPFVLSSGQECDPGPPPAYSQDPSSQLYKEALEVYNTVRSNTPEQLEIALFWADDPGKTATPPGHSLSIVTQVIQQKGYTLDVAAEAYARVGIAVADAFISCWATKYRYNLLRPITYIQKVIDPSWNNPVVTDPVETPPFPEYTSGHSVQSGATAQVLTDMFGEMSFTDWTHSTLGPAPREPRSFLEAYLASPGDTLDIRQFTLSPRSFSSFFEAAEEAAISRLYGGIHYRTAIERGLEQGKCVGKRVSALKFRKDR